VQAIAEPGSAGERVSLATVKLDIIDTNDNSPEFTQEVGFPLYSLFKKKKKKKKSYLFIYCTNYTRPDCRNTM
jgi:hypothetical protein